MKNLLKKIVIFTLALVIFTGLNTQYVEAVIIDNQNILSKSWKRILLDGVDERLYVTNPTNIFSDTSGSNFAYFTFNNLSLADNDYMNISGFGDTTASNGDQMQMGVRRLDASYGSGNKRIEFIWWDGSGTPNIIGTTTNLAIDTLYFVVITSDGSSYKMYINGVEETLIVRSGSNNGNWTGDMTVPGTKYMAVGNTFRRNAWAPNSMNGHVGGFGMTSEVLTQTQITALYNNGKPLDPLLYISESSLRSFYTMGDLENGSISTVHDIKGVNNLTNDNMENGDIVSSNYY